MAETPRRTSEPVGLGTAQETLVAPVKRHSHDSPTDQVPHKRQMQAVQSEQPISTATQPTSPDIELNNDPVIGHGRSVFIAKYPKGSTRVGHRTGYHAAPVRVQVMSAGPAVVSNRPAGRGVRARVDPSRMALLNSEKGYQPYRKAEQILGTTLSPVQDIEGDPEIDNQTTGQDDNSTEHPDVLRPGGAPEENSRGGSPRSRRLPLASNPVDSSRESKQETINPSTNPKRVSHLLPPIDTDGPSNFSRQYIIPTPYPETDAAKARPRPSSPRHGERCFLYLCVNRHNGSPPLFGKVFIPRRQQQPETDHDQSNGGSSNREFDDEKLFERLRTEYGRMRSSTGRLVSLRTLQSLDLVYSSPNALETAATHGLQATVPPNPYLSQYLLLQGYKKPSRGRGVAVWTDWIQHLSSELATNHDEHTKVTVLFKEGWSVSKIALVGLLAWIVSVSAGILWVIFGVNGQGETRLGSAGARVNTGVLLSGVLLFMSWSLLGAWVALSWLIM